MSSAGPLLQPQISLVQASDGTVAVQLLFGTTEQRLQLDPFLGGVCFHK
jgi:hypothetical protein